MLPKATGLESGSPLHILSLTISVINGKLSIDWKLISDEDSYSETALRTTDQMTLQGDVRTQWTTAVYKSSGQAPFTLPSPFIPPIVLQMGDE